MLVMEISISLLIFIIGTILNAPGGIIGPVRIHTSSPAGAAEKKRNSKSKRTRGGKMAWERRRQLGILVASGHEENGRIAGEVSGVRRLAPRSERAD
jgi:hypothetical protein